MGGKVSAMTCTAESAMLCLWKGLGASVGSMIVGTRAFIEKGRVYRKMLGGGMRQAGVIAAAGVVALEKSPGRVGMDHGKAGGVAGGILGISGVGGFGRQSPGTNFIFIFSLLSKTCT